MQTDMGNNRSRAWNMGTLAKRRRSPKTGESRDILTGADWNEGATSKNRSGVSTISESIGGGRHHRLGEVSSERSRASEPGNGQRHRRHCEL